MHIAVIGAGIGGLTTALSLHAAGISVEVYEAVAEIRPLGVGINVLPHAVRELAELGLLDRLAARSVALDALMYTNRFGQEIWSEPRGKKAGYHWPQLSIHRGMLQQILLEAVRERIGNACIHTDHELVRVESTGHDAVATFRSRKDGSARGSIRADVVIGCDGIHSALRAQCYPDEGPPKWNRRIMWRGVTHMAPVCDGRTMIMAGYQDHKFVCYPIEHGKGQNDTLLNWIAELSFPEEHDFRREDWNRGGRVEDFLPQFESWRFGWLDVPAIVNNAEHIYEYPMVDRDPVPRWTHGRFTLLGDAAHAMYPIGSNGASQAIIDARTLAYELATCSSPDEALRRYEADRLPITSNIVRTNRANGPEQTMQLVHERAPEGFKALADVVSETELRGIVDNYRRVAGFDCETLNNRPSLSPPKRPS
jgi:5-methylphenazine-1-carboxylate 1-monooxygenase